MSLIWLQKHRRNLEKKEPRKTVQSFTKEKEHLMRVSIQFMMWGRGGGKECFHGTKKTPVVLVWFSKHKESDRRLRFSLSACQQPIKTRISYIGIACQTNITSYKLLQFCHMRHNFQPPTNVGRISNYNVREVLKIKSHSKIWKWVVKISSNAQINGCKYARVWCG